MYRYVVLSSVIYSLRHFAEIENNALSLCRWLSLE